MDQGPLIIDDATFVFPELSHIPQGQVHVLIESLGLLGGKLLEKHGVVEESVSHGVQPLVSGDHILRGVRSTYSYL